MSFILFVSKIHFEHLFVLTSHVLNSDSNIGAKEDFAGTLAGSTCINIRASEADIQAYVQAQVKSAESLLQICEQDAELENKIQQVIASKAEGM